VSHRRACARRSVIPDGERALSATEPIYRKIDGKTGRHGSRLSRLKALGRDDSLRGWNE
jgi:hypothetical protein